MIIASFQEMFIFMQHQFCVGLSAGNTVSKLKKGKNFKISLRCPSKRPQLFLNKTHLLVNTLLRTFS